MKTLQQIKDEVAHNYGYEDWTTMYNLDEVSNAVIDECMKKYAEEALNMASTKATVKMEKIIRFPDSKLKQTKNVFLVDKNSILSLIEELK